MYWAEELANQDKDVALKEAFTEVAQQMNAQESQIVNELNEVQGQALNTEGYYRPNRQLISAAMRPSAALNELIAAI